MCNGSRERGIKTNGRVAGMRRVEVCAIWYGDRAVEVTKGSTRDRENNEGEQTGVVQKAVGSANEQQSPS